MNEFQTLSAIMAFYFFLSFVIPGIASKMFDEATFVGDLMAGSLILSVILWFIFGRKMVINSK